MHKQGHPIRTTNAEPGSNSQVHARWKTRIDIYNNVKHENGTPDDP